MPWYATFTTNYDTALEQELRSRSRRNVQKVLTESDYPLCRVFRPICFMFS